MNIISFLEAQFVENKIFYDSYAIIYYKKPIATYILNNFIYFMTTMRYFFLPYMKWGESA